MYVCVYVCVRVYVCVCMCVHVCEVCVYVCEVCMYVCACVWDIISIKLLMRLLSIIYCLKRIKDCVF